MRFGHSRQPRRTVRALEHFHGLAETARAQRGQCEGADIEADELLHNHGIVTPSALLDGSTEYDAYELESRRLTAAQLRELADQLDPPVTPFEDDELRIVRCTVALGGITVFHQNLRLKQDEVWAETQDGPTTLGVALSWA